ncbi:hypothetical protein [Burkholderia gladioli]|uniref:hypothetical protein n=1 Tax=Burkholderia gladioli TaxID=28095 RepID=UPI001F49E7C3|nr:hypothetical protein [Burkholderia gladioli]
MNRIRIVDRHHREIYRNELHQGDWREPPAAADAITRERGRPMTHEEIADYAAMLGDILALRTARGRTLARYCRRCPASRVRGRGAPVDCTDSAQPGAGRNRAVFRSEPARGPALD